MYIIYENIDVICTKYSKSPAANPVTRFPSRSSTTAAAAATPSTKASWAREIRVIATGRWVILECSTLEAAWAASKVVRSTSASSAVPITRPNIRTSTEPVRGPSSPTKAPKVTTSITWLGIPATLARVAPLEVEVLAWPAVPISWPAHISCLITQWIQWLWIIQ